MTSIAAPDPITYAKERHDARKSADADAEKARTLAKPKRAARFVLALHTMAAFDAALGIARMSRDPEPALLDYQAERNPYDDTLPEAVYEFVVRQVRLRERTSRIKPLREHFAEWPKTPGIAMAHKRGRSALETAWLFATRVSRGVQDGLSKVVHPKEVTFALLDPLPVMRQGPLPDTLLLAPPPFFVRWMRATMTELRTGSLLPPLSEWTVSRMDDDADNVRSHLWDEWERAQQLATERRTPEAIPLQGLTPLESGRLKQYDEARNLLGDHAPYLRDVYSRIATAHVKTGETFPKFEAWERSIRRAMRKVGRAPLRSLRAGPAGKSIQRRKDS